jgi:hypothetical protein
MAMFEYLCHEGHKTDHLHRASNGERPARIPCEKCGELAHYVFAPPAPTMGCKRVSSEGGTEVRVRGEGHGVRCPDIHCDGCGHDYWAALLAEESTPPCPKCGAAGREQLGALNADEMKRFPYWDRGLGCLVTSPLHRKRIMKERKLIAYDDDNDDAMDRFFGDEDREAERDETAYADYQERLRGHPAFRGYREAVDKGQLAE